MIEICSSFEGILMVWFLIGANVAFSAATIGLSGLRRPWAYYLKSGLCVMMIVAMMGWTITDDRPEMAGWKPAFALLSLMFVYPTLVFLKRGIYLKNHPEKQGYTNPLA